MTHSFIQKKNPLNALTLDMPPQILISDSLLVLQFFQGFKTIAIRIRDLAVTSTFDAGTLEAVGVLCLLIQLILSHTQGEEG